MKGEGLTSRWPPCLVLFRSNIFSFSIITAVILKIVFIVLHYPLMLNRRLPDPNLGNTWRSLQIPPNLVFKNTQMITLETVSKHNKFIIEEKNQEHLSSAHIICVLHHGADKANNLNFFYFCSIVLYCTVRYVI